MERPDIERILQGVLHARDKNPKNEILKDFEEVLIYVKALESVRDADPDAESDEIESEEHRLQREARMRLEPKTYDRWCDESGVGWTVWRHVSGKSDVGYRLVKPGEQMFCVSLEAFQKQVEKWKPE